MTSRECVQQLKYPEENCSRFCRMQHPLHTYVLFWSVSFDLQSFLTLMVPTTLHSIVHQETVSHVIGLTHNDCIFCNKLF